MSQFFFTNGVGNGAALLGTERFPGDLPGGGSASWLASQLKTFALASTGKYTAETNTTSFTSSIGDISGAQLSVLDLTGALGAPATVTTPTAAAILPAIPWAQVGTSWILRIMNDSSGAFAWTLAGGTGVTVVGTATVNQNQWREWLATFTGSAALTLQNIGAGDV